MAVILNGKAPHPADQGWDVPVVDGPQSINRIPRSVRIFTDGDFGKIYPIECPSINERLDEILAEDLAKAWPTDRPEETKPALDPDRFWKATQAIAKGR